MTSGLPPDSFTADARYEIYAALLTLAVGTHGHSDPDVEGELGRRQAWIPDHAAFSLGGDNVPWLYLYLNRLRDTPTSPQDAQVAKLAILAEDATALRQYWSAAACRSADLATTGPRQMPDQELWLSQAPPSGCGPVPLLLEPPPEPPGAAGPEPVF
jgi:hypothetical protein